MYFIFGKGLGNSRLKISNLPECHTDFIFSVLGEELGLVGCIVVVFLFATFLWRGIRTALERAAIGAAIPIAGQGVGRREAILDDGKAFGGKI